MMNPVGLSIYICFFETVFAFKYVAEIRVDIFKDMIVVSNVTPVCSACLCAIQLQKSFFDLISSRAPCCEIFCSSNNLLSFVYREEQRVGDGACLGVHL